MVELPGDYVWSSFGSNGLGKAAKLRTPHPVYQQLGNSTESRSAAYRELFKAHLEPEKVKEIGRTINTGIALGNERFKEEIERLSGRRVVPLRRGPKGKG